MNERQTGATDETAMRLRSWSQKAGISNGEPWEEISDRRKEQWRQLARQCEQDGQVITAAARVPADDELAALNVILRELDSADMIEHLDRNDAPGWGYPYDAVEALRSYLERQR